MHVCPRKNGKILLNRRLCLYWIIKPYFLKTSLSHEGKKPPCSAPEYLHNVFYIQKTKYLPSRGLDSLIGCWMTHVITSGKLKMVLIQNFDVSAKNEFPVMQDVILYKENYINKSQVLCTLQASLTYLYVLLIIIES